MTSHTEIAQDHTSRQSLRAQQFQITREGFFWFYPQRKRECAEFSLEPVKYTVVNDIREIGIKDIIIVIDNVLNRFKVDSAANKV